MELDHIISLMLLFPDLALLNIVLFDVLKTPGNSYRNISHGSHILKQCIANVA